MSLTVIYASTSGNVEFVCQTLADYLSGHSIYTQLHRAEATGIEVIKASNKFILATSTWEHGEINPFYTKLLAEMQQHNLQGKQAAFVGLGDTRYEPVLFCEGMNILQQAWGASGGQSIVQPLKINGEPYEQTDKILTWAQKLLPWLTQ